MDEILSGSLTAVDPPMNSLSQQKTLLEKKSPIQRKAGLTDRAYHHRTSSSRPSTTLNGLWLKQRLQDSVTGKKPSLKLKGLLARAIRSKSYKYAREVLGKIMYLLSTKSSAPRRSKRTTSGNKTTPETEGGNFLQDLRRQLGASVFDSFMAVQGDVSLMFAIDNTGSMREEIQAAKNIAIDIINYPRNSSVKKYILSPFNDPYPGTYKTFYFCIMFVSSFAFFN